MIFFFNKIKTLFEILIQNKILNRPDFSEKKIFLQGKLYENNILKKKKISNFSEVEFSAFSQFGEDGIISWLTNQIPNIKKVFLEIGTEDYWESNTRFLLKSNKWKGYIIEASESDVNKIKKQSLYWKHDISAINEFVEKGNINLIIKNNLKMNDIGFLSLDIDGNDYWILKELEIEADLVVCEYNPIFGDKFELTIPYEKNFDRSKKHFSKLFFGCSIRALISLMDKKKYCFLGTNTQGMNAFFVNRKKLEHFNEKIENKKIFPPLSREGRDENGKLNFNSLYENLKFIENLEVYDIKEKNNKKISEFKNIYSEEWKNSFL